MNQRRSWSIHRRVAAVIAGATAVTGIGAGVMFHVSQQSDREIAAPGGGGTASCAGPGNACVITIELARPMRITELWLPSGANVRGLRIIEKS